LHAHCGGHATNPRFDVRRRDFPSVATRKVPQSAANRTFLAPGDGFNIGGDTPLSVDTTRRIEARGGDGIE
jgi:hypothetical protein